MTSPARDWEIGSGAPQPDPDEIHVWIASMTDDAGDPRDLSALAPEEADRVHNARSAIFCESFVRSRSVLRRLLSRYLGVPPAEIPLEYNFHGRPSVSLPFRGELDFNLSHTGDWGVFAFGWGRRVGIDLERLDRKVDWRRIAAKSFSPLEREHLNGALDSGPFLRAWVRKEAYSKGRGDGFAYGFSDFSVAVEADHRGCGLLEDHHDPDALNRWWIRDLELGAPLASALAGEGECRTIRRWRYTPL